MQKPNLTKILDTIRNQTTKYDNVNFYLSNLNAMIYQGVKLNRIRKSLFPVLTPTKFKTLVETFHPSAFGRENLNAKQRREQAAIEYVNSIIDPVPTSIVYHVTHTVNEDGSVKEVKQKIYQYETTYYPKAPPVAPKDD